MFSRPLTIVRDMRDFWAYWKTLPSKPKTKGWGALPSKPAHLMSDEEIDALPEEGS